MKIAYLSFVPFALAEESPFSAIKRTARANGFKSCRRLFSYLVPLTGCSNHCYALAANSETSKMLQMCAPEVAHKIAAIFYRPIYPLLNRGTLSINGIEILHSNLRLKESAICTECLNEEYERFTQDITLFTHCPYHNRAFLMQCPSCGQKLKWKVQLTDICKCGHQLVSPECSDAEARLDHYFLTLFQTRNTEQMEKIQKHLTTLERGTKTENAMVKFAILNLAVAISCDDVEWMTQAIHGCLPSNNSEEIDISLSLFKNDLSEGSFSKLRLQLMSTAYDRTTPLAKLTLNSVQLREYVGISEKAWYNLKQHHSLFKGIGFGTQASLEEALAFRKAVLAEQHKMNELAQTQSTLSHHQILSIGAVGKLTDLPEHSIRALALKTNLLGRTKRYIKQLDYGPELIFCKESIDWFVQRYVCSSHLSHEWHMPKMEIDAAIKTLKLEVKKCEFTQGVVIIRKSAEVRLFNAMHNQPGTLHVRRKRMSPPVAPDRSEYLSSSECGTLIGTTGAQVVTLVREGLIPCHATCKMGGYLIRRQDALNFNKEYIRIPELASKLQVSRSVVSRLLASVGIYPATGRLVNSGYMTAFKRGSVPAATLNALKSQRKRNKKSPQYRKPIPLNDADFCINTSTLYEKFALSKLQFFLCFLKNEIIPYRTIKYERFITKEGSTKLDVIMEHYASYATASKILRTPPDYIHRMVNKKKLMLDDSLFLPAHNPGLISYKQIDQLLSRGHDARDKPLPR